MLAHAFVAARRSTCNRAQVGAVLVRDGRVLSTGRNGAPTGMPHCACTPAQPCTESVHAEANSIAFAARHGVASEGASLVATHGPCLGCAGVLINAGLVAVYYHLTYRDGSGVARLRDAGLHVEQIEKESS